jgi:hypothetical protein
VTFLLFYYVSFYSPLYFLCILPSKRERGIERGGRERDRERGERGGEKEREGERGEERE